MNKITRRQAISIAGMIGATAAGIVGAVAVTPFVEAKEDTHWDHGDIQTPTGLFEFQQDGHIKQHTSDTVACRLAVGPTPDWIGCKEKYTPRSHYFPVNATLPEGWRWF